MLVIKSGASCEVMLFPTDSGSVPTEWQHEAEDSGESDELNMLQTLWDFWAQILTSELLLSLGLKNTSTNKAGTFVDRHYGVLNQYPLMCYLSSKRISNYVRSRKNISWDWLFHKTSKLNCLLPWSMSIQFDFANYSWAFMNMHTRVSIITLHFSQEQVSELNKRGIKSNNRC